MVLSSRLLILDTMVSNAHATVSLFNDEDRSLGLARQVVYSYAMLKVGRRLCWSTMSQYSDMEERDTREVMEVCEKACEKHCSNNQEVRWISGISACASVPG